MNQPPNEIKIETHGDIIVLDIRGDVTAFSEPTLNSAYNSAKQSGPKKILLKFEETAYINSGGIAVLIQVLAQTRRNNQKIGITGLSDHFKKVFNMVGITKFATIYPTLQDALSAMSAMS
jgi:stage II sporulation protein AA (anti-sigma F factor antagonist)